MSKAGLSAEVVISPETARSRKGEPQPFLGLIDAILIAPGGPFTFEGALARDHAQHIWVWLVRDVAPDLIGDEAPGGPATEPGQLVAALPQIYPRVKETLALAAESFEGGRRLRAQLGGEEVFERLPFAMASLRHRALIENAQAFGRGVNAISEDSGLITALQSMPLQDETAAALLMQAAVGQVANPARLITAAIRIAGTPSDAAITRAGFAPMVYALLAHAQNQIPGLATTGPFVDIDLVCRGLDRFNRLVRAVSGYIELSRGHRWVGIIATLTKAVSEQIEPKLRELVIDVNQALRRREGTDRVDSDRVLAAINGLYLLATVRDCRDSLALNALFDQCWTQVGEALEMQINRNLDLFRTNPADRIVAGRLDAAIKMAELRFNAEYADVLRRARDAARRAGEA